MVDSFAPRGKVGNSQGHIDDPMISYNQSGVTYNDSRYAYGGFYGFADFIPITLSGMRTTGTSVAPPVTSSRLQNEDGTYLLLEDGTYILLETAVASSSKLLNEDGTNLLNEDGSFLLLEINSNQVTVVTSYVYNDILPFLRVGKSQGLFDDPGITYDQGGVSYNDSRYAYGGFYGQADGDFVPAIRGIDDAYVAPTPPPVGSSIALGPGFFLYITH